MNPTKERDLAAWIIAEGLRGTAELQLLAGFCDRLVEAGIPLLRANINKRTAASTGFRQRLRVVAG